MQSGKKKYQIGGTFDDIRNYYSSYINSPIYKQRLIQQGYGDEADTSIQDRLEALRTLKIGFDNKPFIGSRYQSKIDSSSGNHTIFLNPLMDGLKEIPRTMIPHEVSHGMYAPRRFGLANVLGAGLSEQEERQIGLRNRMNVRLELLGDSYAGSKDYNPHDADPDEVKADLDAFRYMLYKEGMYNAGTEEFTK